MTSITNTRLLMNQSLQNRVSEIPEPGKTIVVDRSEKINLEHAPLEGGALIKILVLSINLDLESQIRDASVPLFMPAYKDGEPIHRYGVDLIIKSGHFDVKVGDHIYGILRA